MWVWLRRGWEEVAAPACRLMRLAVIETGPQPNFNGFLQLPCGERHAAVLFFAVPTGAKRSGGTLLRQITADR